MAGHGSNTLLISYKLSRPNNSSNIVSLTSSKYAYNAYQDGNLKQGSKGNRAMTVCSVAR